LAGGNFYWVQTDGQDDQGHNIFDTNPDDSLLEAPGNYMGCTGNGSCHDSLHDVSANGPGGLWDRRACTKCHMVDDTYGPIYKGFHHADDSNVPVGGDVNDTDGYFRFLKGHMSGDHLGVCGIEDDDWQATFSDSDHNEYLGNSAAKDTAGQMIWTGPTMTGYCGGCHGIFHISSNSAGGGNWIRHPSGAVLPNSGEFASYTTFDPDVPVGRPDLTGWTGPDSTVTPGLDLANCLSCHRAHGSPYPKMLRWDMTDRAGACATCHTNLKK
jgi:predicted CXXCH cytochrome family protein